MISYLARYVCGGLLSLAQAETFWWPTQFFLLSCVGGSGGGKADFDYRQSYYWKYFSIVKQGNFDWFWRFFESFENMLYYTSPQLLNVKQYDN